MLGILILLLIALPWIGLGNYLLQVLINSLTYGMLGLAFALTLKVGLPRFDAAAWWAVGAYTSAELIQKAGWPFWPTILIAGIVSVILGWICYVVAMPRGMMVFLLFSMVIVLAIYQILGSVKFFGGWGGTGVLPPVSIGNFEFTSQTSLYLLGLCFLALNVVVYYLLFHSRIGRAWDAIGSSLKLASSVGVDVVKYRMVNVLIGNFFLGLAGSYTFACNQLATPSLASFSSSVNVMMYVVVGGMRFSLAGPLIGAVIITFIPEYLRAAREWKDVFSSIAIILIIIFLPQGLLGLFEKYIIPWFTRSRFFARLRGKTKEEPLTSS